MDGEYWLSPVSNRGMPHLRALASTGVNFLNTYAASPQCVPSRAAMFTGRRTDQTRAWSNEQGVAGIPKTGALDKVCLQLFGEETCSYFREQQNVSATIVDTLRELGMEPSLYGKVDVGAGIMQDRLEANATCNVSHGPRLSIVTPQQIYGRQRSGSISQTTRTTMCTKKTGKCFQNASISRNKAEQKRLGTKAPRNWMLYCSINIPHPAFDTNDVAINGARRQNSGAQMATERISPADSYMSQVNQYGETLVLVHKVRKTYPNVRGNRLHAWLRNRSIEKLWTQIPS